jgi:hypothetical protein
MAFLNGQNGNGDNSPTEMVRFQGPIQRRIRVMVKQRMRSP